MNPFRSPILIRQTIIAASLVLIWLPAQAADQHSAEVEPSVAVSAGEISSFGMGVVEDTLNACLARIPKDSTTGQRLIAEDSCHRDEMDRKIIQAVPDTEYASR
jgi:hypothetical protein